MSTQEQEIPKVEKPQEEYITQRSDSHLLARFVEEITGSKNARHILMEISPRGMSWWENTNCVSAVWSKVMASGFAELKESAELAGALISSPGPPRRI